MLRQFFNKPFWIILASLAGFFALSVLVFETALVPILLGVVLIITAIVSARKLEYGLVIAFAELFANSHGHLVSGDIGGFPLSLRMAVFLGVIFGWVIAAFLRRADIDFSDVRLRPFIAIGVAAAFGLAIGVSKHGGDAFADGNAYFYLAYILPILSVRWTPLTRQLLLQTLVAAAVWVTLLSLGLFYIFSHVPEFMLPEVYRFIRDTRTGELTKMIEGIFRVFIQAQFSVAIALLVMIPILWVKTMQNKTRWIYIGVMGAFASVMLLSLSRSFWVALIAATVIHLILAARFLVTRMKDAWKPVGSFLLINIAAVVLLLAVLFFPIPQYQGGTFGDFTNLFTSRATQTTDAAIDSRWKLLDPMIALVKTQPIVGHGFGQKVAFITDDPRIRAEQPDGFYETYALEWGWVELWLKMGILGPLAFLYAAFFLIRGLWGYLREERAWLGVGLISAIVFLYVTHIFSPYLNHPLGLGVLLFVVPFLKETQKKKTSGSKLRIESAIKPVKTAAVTPTTVSRR